MELCCRQCYRQQKALAATKENFEIYDSGNIHKFMSTYTQTLKILTLLSHYILSLMTFMAHNLGHFTFNISVHGTNKSKKLQFHRLIANLTHLLRKVCIMQA